VVGEEIIWPKAIKENSIAIQPYKIFINLSDDLIILDSLLAKGKSKCPNICYQEI